jgi:hypothetical protein
MLYLALFPHREGVIFNNEFIERAPSRFLEFLPDEIMWDSVIRVIDLAKEGKKMILNANAVKQRAVCYLDKI